MRRRTRFLIAGYVVLLALLAAPRMASATFWGGSWPYNSSQNNALLYLPYSNQTGGDGNISGLVGPAATEAIALSCAARRSTPAAPTSTAWRSSPSSWCAGA